MQARSIRPTESDLFPWLFGGIPIDDIKDLKIVKSGSRVVNFNEQIMYLLFLDMFDIFTILMFQ